MLVCSQCPVAETACTFRPGDNDGGFVRTQHYNIQHTEFITSFRRSNLYVRSRVSACVYELISHSYCGRLHFTSTSTSRDAGRRKCISYVCVCLVCLLPSIRSTNAAQSSHSTQINDIVYLHSGAPYKSIITLDTCARTRTDADESAAGASTRDSLRFCAATRRRALWRVYDAWCPRVRVRVLYDL